MSEVIEQESTELVALPTKESALTVYSTQGGLEPYLQRIKAEIDAFVPDTSTAKGRAAIASMAFKVAKIKTAIEGLGKTVSAELKEIPKKVDAERKRTREKLELWQTEVRKPLTDWEEAEEARIDAHKARLSQMESCAVSLDGRTADELKSAISLIEEYAINETWEEFETEAARAKDKALTNLRTALATREKHEAEQAELAKLRAEAEVRRIQDEKERIAKEAAEAATKAAEAKAQAERDAAAKREADAKAEADRRELELKLKAETAERERLEAIQRAEKDRADAIERADREMKAAQERQAQAVEAERQRQADEAERVAAETRKREANKAHKAKINNAALSAFIAEGLTAECAKLAVMLIATKKIPGITINY